MQLQQHEQLWQLQHLVRDRCSKPLGGCCICPIPEAATPRAEVAWLQDDDAQGLAGNRGGCQSCTCLSLTTAGRCIPQKPSAKTWASPKLSSLALLAHGFWQCVPRLHLECRPVRAALPSPGAWCPEVTGMLRQMRACLQLLSGAAGSRSVRLPRAWGRLVVPPAIAAKAAAAQSWRSTRITGAAFDQLVHRQGAARAEMQGLQPLDRRLGLVLLCQLSGSWEELDVSDCNGLSDKGLL